MKTQPSASRVDPSSHGNGHAPHAGRGPDAAHGRPGALGMAIFLVSLGVLFAASLVAYVVLRVRAGPPAQEPPLPRILLLSTALILAGSATIQVAVSAVAANRQLLLRWALVATLVLGTAFLACQAAAWIALVEARVTPRAGPWDWAFYFLTGLHAAHVVGGLLPLGVVTVNSFYGRYSPLRPSPPRFVAMYWHFLGAVWITLYAVLALTR